MVREVNFEGKQILDLQLPNDSLFIKGMWYSSADKLPPGLKERFASAFDKETKVFCSVPEPPYMVVSAVPIKSIDGVRQCLRRSKLKPAHDLFNHLRT